MLNYLKQYNAIYIRFLFDYYSGNPGVNQTIYRIKKTVIQSLHVDSKKYRQKSKPSWITRYNCRNTEKFPSNFTKFYSYTK